MSSSSEGFTDGTEEQGAIQWGMTRWLVKKANRKSLEVRWSGREVMR